MLSNYRLRSIHEFSEPWKNPNIALAIDPFEGNPIDWAQLARQNASSLYSIAPRLDFVSNQIRRAQGGSEETRLQVGRLSLRKPAIQSNRLISFWKRKA
jgi:hypothetical protein